MMPELPEAFNALLTPEECADIDATLLPTRDRFSIRISVYSWRYLQQVSQGVGVAIAHLDADQITTWVRQDPALQTSADQDDAFAGWFAHLLTSSLGPLTRIAGAYGLEIEDLTLEQIIRWFEAQVKSQI